MAITSDSFKSQLRAEGKSIAEWAFEHGFKAELVYAVLRRRTIPLRGESHRIAVALGIKDGRIRGVSYVNGVIDLQDY